MGHLKGRFQSLRGLRQNINSETDYKWALAWVRVCLIIHGLAMQIEVTEEDEDFWTWVHEGLDGATEEGDAEVEGFIWNNEPRAVGETEGQLKRRLVKEALFEALYPPL